MSTNCCQAGCDESALSFSEVCWGHADRASYLLKLKEGLDRTAPAGSGPFNFKKIECDGFDFSNLDLKGSSFSQAKLSNCSFIGTGLSEANLIGASFSRCDFVAVPEPFQILFAAFNGMFVDVTAEHSKTEQ